MQRRERSFSRVLLVLFLVFFIWFVLQVLAPVQVPPQSISDLSGMVGIQDNNHLTYDMPFPSNIMYSLGDRLCHQKAERSFFLNGNQMPFCARCTAIWGGLAIGVGIMVFYALQLNEKFLIIIVCGIVPLALDGVGQLVGLWESTNSLRFITGIAAGGACGIAIGVIIDEVKPYLLRKNKHQ